jgi:pyruvate/2-oxoglutarate dehydrogenase complex dihydrolipoamide acyltransferase (E2) component
VRRALTWAGHEAWLADVLEPLDDDVTPRPLAACFHGDDATWLVDVRRERSDDEVDPLTEVAVLVAELAPSAAVVAMPTRMRDLGSTDRSIIGRTWVTTSITRRADGGHDLRARWLPGGVGTTSDVDIELSPLASVLDDAVRHRVGVTPQQALFAAAAWGHDLYSARVDADAAGRDAAGDSPDTRAAEPRSNAGAVRAAEAARHRLRRHAADLAARHRPTAPWPEARRRPAVHAGTPDGWVTACPV